MQPTRRVSSLAVSLIAYAAEYRVQEKDTMCVSGNYIQFISK